MAQKYLVQLVDDLSQEPIEDAGGETIDFGLDGISYTIDLNDAHSRELRAALEHYVAAAQRMDVTETGGTRHRSTTSHDTRSVRSWAEANGIAVSSRGRVSREVAAAYAAAHWGSNI